MMDKPNILVVGDAMLDRYWSGTVERVSPDAAVPIVRMGDIEDRPGGAANVAINLAKLGADVTLAGLIGQDEPGAALLPLLERDGVRWEGMALAEHRTTLKIRHVARHQHLLRSDFERMPHPEWVEVFTRRLVAPMVRHFDLVVLSDYGKGALGLCGEIISASNSCGIRALVDPKGTDWAKYAGAWLLKPNEAELSAVAGAWHSRVEMAAKADHWRRRLQVDHMIVTRGEHGMLVFSEDTCTSYPAEAREVFDVCGAGDTVLATLALAVARGSALSDAVRLANRAAGIVVARFGTASVTVDELLELLERPHA
jgi:rfaE bifunctional protein kinase chain/domain